MKWVYRLLYNVGMLILVIVGRMMVDWLYPEMSTFESTSLGLLFAIAVTLAAMEGNQAYERDEK